MNKEEAMEKVILDLEKRIKLLEEFNERLSKAISETMELLKKLKK